MDEKLAKISQNMGGLSGDTSKATSSMSAALQKVGDIGVKALKVGVVGAIAAVAASIPGAVKRIDTLVAFPRVLEAMGASSVQAATATDTLAKRLSGLPTPLQEGAAGVQALVSAGLGVEQATDVFLAFNNATLAASTEAGAAQGAFTQLVQSISKGKIEGQEWNSMVAAMPTAFQALSKESGKTREELRELYRTNPQKLLDDLTKLDKEGGGGLASLDEQARAATGGIGTSFANMRNAIVRGLEGIVKKLGDGSLEAGQKKISDMITKVGKAFEKALDFIGEVVAYIMDNKDIFGALAVSIGVLVGAITAATIAMGIFNAVMAINQIALIVMAVAALVAGLIYLWNTSDGFRNFFIGMWGAIVTAVQPVIDIFNAYLLPALQMVWGFIVNQFQKAWEDLKKAYEQIKQTLQPYIDQMKGPLMEVLKAVGIAIAVAVIAPLALLVGAIIAVVAVIATIISAISRFIGWIANLYAELVKVATLVAGHVANSFSNAWSKIAGVWSAAVGFFSGVASGIVNHLSSLPGKMREVFDKAVSAIKSIDWGGIGKNIIEGIGNGIANMGK
ncbi:hypothetical protein EOL96_08255, partial [Candidatus Saccharibacteria bacterium]|nr:hypothetical protein [Candidatus Saccharibacteria bacterium]